MSGLASLRLRNRNLELLSFSNFGINSDRQLVIDLYGAKLSENSMNSLLKNKNVSILSLEKSDFDDRWFGHDPSGNLSGLITCDSNFSSHGVRWCGNQSSLILLDCRNTKVAASDLRDLTQSRSLEILLTEIMLSDSDVEILAAAKNIREVWALVDNVDNFPDKFKLSAPRGVAHSFLMCEQNQNKGDAAQ